MTSQYDDPDVEHCIQKEGACWYDEDNKALQMDETERTVTVDDDSLDLHAALVRDRLKRAGVRLGALLSEALAE